MENPTQDGISPDLLRLMHGIGYMHESEVEIVTSTTPRSRARWKSPRGVMFGNEKWFPIAEVKKHLDARATWQDEEELRAIL